MIKPIVEGHSEVPALPVLLRRIAGECFQVWHPPLLPPGRYPSSRLIRTEDNVWVPGPDFEKAGGHARNEGATAILAVLDLDDACPKELHESIAPKLAESTGIAPSALVFAKREYEAWFLADAESLGENVLPYPGDPEGVRDAKGALEEHLQLDFPYDATTDQPRYSRRLNLARVHERSRSFRKLVKEFRCLLDQCGCSPAVWPEFPEP